MLWPQHPSALQLRYDPLLFFICFFCSLSHLLVPIPRAASPTPSTARCVNPPPLLASPGCIGHCPVGSAHYVVPLGPGRYADAHGMCTLCLCPRLPCPSPRVCAHSHDCTTTGGSGGGSLFGNTAMMTANQPQPQTGGGGGSLFGSSASNQPQSQSGGGGGGLFGSSCHRRRSDND